jgi:transcriptional regulator with XRE-family HTH domain
MDTFGKRLRISRKIKNMTQEDLALKVGMSGKGIISTWENDNAFPKKETIEIIAKLLDVTYEWLVTGLKLNAQKDGTILITMEEYVEYMKLKNEKLEVENEKLKKFIRVHSEHELK